MIGTFVLNERIFPIRELYLDRGQFNLVIDIPGALWDPGDGRYCVFDPKGELVYQGALGKDTTRSRAHPESHWVLTIGCGLIGKITPRAQKRMTAGI